MRIVRSIRKMQALAIGAKRKGLSIGLVPTMGALHDGHLSLIRKASQENDFVVVSIFVNPAQFGPREDFKKYPRDLKRDAGMCAREEVDIIFYPNVVEIYPEDYRTYITVEELSNCLCGRFRPGHFKGVATVVSKLFNIVQPDTSYFGQKDAQQSIIIKRMVRDLNIPVKIKVLPTIRERDGLAMSSRNSYLSPQKRKDALIAYESLNLAKDLIKSGIRDTAKIISRMERLIKKKKDSAKIDYISIVDLENLKPLKRIFGNCLIVLAIFIGKTRLIDNFILRGPEARRTNT